MLIISEKKRSIFIVKFSYNLVVYHLDDGDVEADELQKRNKGKKQQSVFKENKVRQISKNFYR